MFIFLFILSLCNSLSSCRDKKVTTAVLCEPLCSLMEENSAGVTVMVHKPSTAGYHHLLLL